MSKRTKDILTGGTGDVNLQTLSARVQTGAPVAGVSFGETRVPVPVLRVAQNPNTAQVIEALWCEFEFSSLGLFVPSFDGAGDSVRASITTNSQPSMPHLDNSNLIALTGFRAWMFNAPGPGAAGDTVLRVDLTDQAGHGMIIATQDIFLQGSGINMAVPLAIPFRMGYRFKLVSLQEFVGLAIQSSS